MSSATAPSEVEEVAQQPSRDRGPQGLWRRHRSTLLILAALVVAVAIAALGGGDPGTTEPLDPDNANPDGARALAQVLVDQGVDVETARGLDELEETDVPGGSTVVVTSPEHLSPRVVSRIRAHIGDARLVVVGPQQGVLEALEVGVDETAPQDDDDTRPARCDDRLMRDLTLDVDPVTPYTGPGCFPSGGTGRLLVETGGVTLVGAPLALSNEQILQGDNAAFALRLLGQSDRLIWYVTSIDDVGADEGVSLVSLLPRWVLPGLFLLGLVMVAVVVWRGRRLGPLATEPLPVTVKAIETTLSRGRLYRRAGDRAHAASRLRSATRARVAERLHGGAKPDEATLVRDLAAHLGRPHDELEHLLGSDAATPANDRDLISLANALTELEEEVRHR